MDGERYPPFSAPATIERRKKGKSRSWLRSAKEVFMKPWKNRPSNRKQPQRRAHQRKPLSPAFDPYNQRPGGFSFAELQSNIKVDHDSQRNLFGGNVPLPFSGNRLSPDGGPAVSSVESESEVEINIPETAYGSRPPLSNIFPMAASPNNTSSSNTKLTASSPQSPLQTKPVAARASPPLLPSVVTTPPRTSDPTQPATPTTATTPTPKALQPPINIVTPQNAAVLPLQSSFSTSQQLQAISPIPFNQRRHSTPITSSLSAPTTPRDNRRPSASSDISADKLRHLRRDRRSSVTRDLPFLPKRGQDPLQFSSHSSTMSSTSYSGTPPYWEYMRPCSPQQQLGAIETLATAQRPPVAPGGQTADEGQAFQVFLPPQAQLEELQEELDDDDEPDGAEKFLTMIDEEMDEPDNLYPPVTTNPIALANRMPIVVPPSSMGQHVSGADKEEEKSGLKIFNKRSGGADKKKQKGKAFQMPPSEPEPEVKGFDGFFLY